jgi:hypothetical protein
MYFTFEVALLTGRGRRSKKKAIGMNSGLVCEIANRELTFAFF